MNYESHTVVKLKQLLRDRGLKVAGRKDELILRLIESDQQEKVPQEQSVVKAPEKLKFAETDKVIAFYGHKDGKYACFSNWCRSAFVESAPQPRTFYSTEQYLMWRKAELFGDEEAASSILSLVGPGVYTPAQWNAKMGEVKRMGRQVRHFDENIWKEHREDIMYDGLLLKFTQNDNLRELLLSTGDKTIVEAAPRDRVWGVGVGVGAATDVTKWRGLNLLGKSLMRVRETLSQET